MMDEKPRLAFYWDWQCDPLWPDNDAAYELLGLGPADLEELGLPDPLIVEIRDMGAWHETSLNWDSPADPGPWRQEECDRFNAASLRLFAECERLLGDRFQLEYTHTDEREDPDLDRYLADPQGFTR